MKTAIAALLLVVACSAHAKKTWEPTMAQAATMCSSTAADQMAIMSMRYNRKSKEEAIAQINNWSMSGRIAPIQFTAYKDMIDDMWSSEMNADLRANWSPQRVFAAIYDDCMTRVAPKTAGQ